MNKKNYNTAPLPFMGQKRAFVKEFKRVLASYPDDVTIIDMFGGSGLLSHVAKSEKPNATVVYNDFDDYSFRLRNVDSTNQLLNDIRAILVDYPRKQLINKELKDKILSRIEIEDNAGYVDYITLSGSLLFSMKYELSLSGFKKQTLYNKVRISDYCADGYLSGVNVVRKDYKELFAEYSGKKNVLYLIDPPYLSTEVGTYNMNWQLKDYLDVLNVLCGSSFIYFTSNKSSIIELCDWVGNNQLQGDPFRQATKIELNKSMNYNSQYTDIMLYTTPE